MIYLIGPMFGVVIAQTYTHGHYLAAVAIAFIAGLWCAWPQKEKS